jgi:hypothetical protein
MVATARRRSGGAWGHVQGTRLAARSLAGSVAVGCAAAGGRSWGPRWLPWPASSPAAAWASIGSDLPPLAAHLAGELQRVEKTLIEQLLPLLSDGLGGGGDETGAATDADTGALALLPMRTAARELE